MTLMYWTFYRSTLTLNFFVSFLFSFLTGADLFVYLPVCFATIGLFAVFLYKEIARPFEYYFYYNHAITKIKLILFCLIANILLAALILTIKIYVA